MVNVHTPKPPKSPDAIRKRNTPTLAPASLTTGTVAADSSSYLIADESEVDLRARTGEKR